ncbi:Heat shock protein DnaJ [Penicillium cf. griseofulvum]|uniref:Heat shock protein DnaJ n=1 Tax=Penicillium cf. griseofulvum TaxID=2972120 RepID=A0A9W9MFY9_9EURO|nr:Heat shock protein DnaJ [Penicillium cf. griseofulvum]KAJ5424075.1 Heat shock protein DnaJ [Penicillium cf. griseofulvum]KAJ5442685.1 Heat shock protein DnaJ [Penicillium cf. griseofulvum]
MPNDDLKAHAASNQDFYALLDIQPAATETEIRRAYRRTALKYHPDKIKNPTVADIDKFHVLQIAYDVLSDQSVRQLYDNAREARMRKQRERDMMGAAKRKMREDLEARERAGAAEMGGAGVKQGVKRSWAAGGDEDAEEKLQREIDRIAEDGRRRRREAEEKAKKELDDEQKKIQQQEEEARKAADRSSQRVDRSKEGGAQVPELERAVKVRWVREGRGLDLDIEKLAVLFKPFGKIENTIALKDKRQRIGENKEKKTVATGVVVFMSIVSAHAAVIDSEKKIRQHAGQDGEWGLIESVFWATGNQPDLGPDTSSKPVQAEPTPAPPGPFVDTSSRPNKPSFNFQGLKTAPQSDKAPSFGSFASASAAAAAPSATSFNASTKAPTVPSLQEVMMMRLKNAQREKERKALEEELIREDEAADAAEAAAAKGT